MEYGCYKNEYGEYIWTNEPQSNWIFISEIKTPMDIPKSEQSTPTPGPASTPAPGPASTPAPGPAPIDYQTNTAYRANNLDGSYSIVDKYSGNELYRVYSNDEVKLLDNKFQNEIGKIHASQISLDDVTGIITIKDDQERPVYSIKNGEIIEKYDYSFATIDIGDKKYEVKRTKYNGSGEVIDYEVNFGHVTRVYLADKNTLVKTIYDDGTYEVYKSGKTIVYDSNNKKIKTVYEDGSYEVYKSDFVVKYDAQGKEYMYLYKDGKRAYINNEYLVLYPDGTFYNYKEHKKGTYSINHNGYIICIDSDNITSIYDKNGSILHIIDNTGKTTDYDYNKMSKTVTTDDKKHVSRINHIEYDELAYNKVLNTLNNINGRDINASCSSIISSINRFPDSYSIDGISGVENSINKNISLISSLSEMTNYSLLAYQACDENLKDNLNALIDALFDNNEAGKMFKKSIGFTIEDRDDDGILEYKNDTDFRKISDDLIPTQTYIDSDRNILYFNNKGKLLSFNGENIKINYGGEKFILNFGENGCPILKDSKGNPLNIFGEYNLESCQYGGNQENFLNENNAYLLNDERINSILDKYFPGASYEQKQAYLNNIAKHGCGYVAMTNMVFRKMEGYEVDFQKNFGYPMYDVIYKDGQVVVDYNYEPLVLELYSEVKGKKAEIGKVYGKGETFEQSVPIEIASKAGGMGYENYYLEKYLVENYKIYDYNKDNDVTVLSAQSGWYIINDNDRVPGFGAHAMAITEETSDGKTYVSSYGQKYLYGVNEENHHDIKREYPLNFPNYFCEDFYGDGKTRIHEYNFSGYYDGVKSSIVVCKDDDENYFFYIKAQEDN